MPAPAGSGAECRASLDPQTPAPNRGRLLAIAEIRPMLPPRSNGEPRTNWWFNHSFLPSKAVKIGRQQCWYQADVDAAIATGKVTE